jgi:hypothetical protein
MWLIEQSLRQTTELSFRPECPMGLRPISAKINNLSHPSRLVISNEVEGSAVSPQPLQPEPPLSPCHPDRSVAKWRDLQCALRLSQILPGKRLGGNQLSHAINPKDRTTSFAVSAVPSGLWKSFRSLYRSGFVRTDGLRIAYLGAYVACGPPKKMKMTRTNIKY